MSKADSDLLALVETIFADKSGHDVVERAEAAGLPRPLWDQLAGLGLTLIGLPEESGGSGGSMADLAGVLIAAGRHAVPLPLAENHLAGWLAEAAGVAVPTGVATVALDDERDNLTCVDGRAHGTLHRVPWARDADVVAALLPGASDADTSLVLLDPTTAELSRGADLAGQPQDKLVFTDVAVECLPSTIDVNAFHTRGALLRSAQLAGAIEATFELTRSYVSARIQFGRPVGSFQAVQQHVVTLAQMSAASVLAVDRAVAALAAGDGAFEAVATKIVVSENAQQCARAAHQAHGAIGMTKEYRLQQLTRRLHSWRSDFGSESASAERLGRRVTHVPSFANFVSATRPTMEDSA